MKKGQFVRFDYGWVYIGKIAEYDEINYIGLDGKKHWCEIDDEEVEIIGKPSDNLVDLLKVGDIVQYKVKINDDYTEEVETILNEFWFKHIKKYIKENKITITAVELAENRKKQMIGSESE